MTELPSWLLPEPGFRFITAFGHECIVLGEGTFEDFDIYGNVSISRKPGDAESDTQHHSIGVLMFRGPSLIGAINHSGGFTFVDIYKLKNLEQGKPLSR